MRVTGEGGRGRGAGGGRRSDQLGCGGEMSMSGADFNGVGEDPRIFRNICRDRTLAPTQRLSPVPSPSFSRH